MTENTTSKTRFCDAAYEPRRRLPPIQGYEKFPLASIADASQPLISLVPEIARMVWTAKQTNNLSEDGLTDDEHAAILLYTMEWEPEEQAFHFILNTNLQTAHRPALKPWFLYLRLIMNALAKLPSKSAPFTVYRGVKANLSSQYPMGSVVVWWGFSSTTLRLNVLEDERFLGKSGTRTLFIIDCFSGKNIQQYSYYPDEEEVLLPPGRQLEVIGYLNPSDDLHVIHLKELHPEFPWINPVEPPPSTSLCTSTISSPSEQSRVTWTTTSVDSTQLTEDSRISFSEDRTFTSIHHPVPALSALPEIRDHARSSKHTTLGGLDLSWNAIRVREARFLANILQQNRTISTLNLSESQIDDQGVQHLAEVLQQNRTIITLDLSGNQIDDGGIKCLAEILQRNETLTTLNLSKNTIGVDGARYLAEVLRQNRTITALNLSSNAISVQGTKYLAEALQHNNTISLLDLSEDRVDDEGTKYLAEALQRNRSLTTIVLYSNGIGMKGAQYLGEALQHNRTITTVNLAWNEIGVRGTSHLAKAFQQNATVTTVVLSGNRIRAQGAAFLAEAFQHNRTITAVNLSWNHIGTQGVQCLSQALQLNRTINALDLSGNRIDDQGAQHLAEVLQRNRTFIALNLSRNEIGADGARCLAETLQQNDTAVTLDLSGNEVGALRKWLIKKRFKDTSKVTILFS